MKSTVKTDARTHEEYVEQVVTPLLSGEQLAPSAARRLTQVKADGVSTKRPLSPFVREMRRAMFAADLESKPDLPPPAIEHIREGCSSYELIDEQHAGLGYLDVHDTLTVWIVRRIRYDQA